MESGRNGNLYEPERMENFEFVIVSDTNYLGVMKKVRHLLERQYKREGKLQVTPYSEGAIYTQVMVKRGEPEVSRQ